MTLKKLSIMIKAVIVAVILTVLHYIGHYWIAPIFPQVNSVIIVEIIVFITTFIIVYFALKE